MKYKERKNTDKAIFKAANEIGFLKISGLKNFQFNERSKKILLSIFKLPEESKKKLCRWYFENSNQNVYRGWFPLQNGLPTYKQGIDIGPDLVREVIHNPNDPLTQGDVIVETVPDATFGFNFYAKHLSADNTVSDNAIVRSQASMIMYSFYNSLNK